MVTIIPTEVGLDRLQAVFLKGHLKLLAAGMKNSTMSGTTILAKTSRITGKTYKRGQYEQARKDLEEMLK
jgi:hypothetical protein